MLENISSYSMDGLYAHQQPENPIGYGLQKISNACLPEFFRGLPVESNSIAEMELSGSRSKSISPAASISSTKRRNSPGRCNRKNMKKEGEKEKQVVHVRAKRGQATDNHSIAERVRREKISSRLRCLQEIVPGCHKSMGMAVMLEEIINYVHSLQNQVEFLSMELTAASYPSNTSINTFPPRKPQGTNSPESQELQKWSREGFGSHYSLPGPFDCNFGLHSLLPQYGHEHDHVSYYLFLLHQLCLVPEKQDR